MARIFVAGDITFNMLIYADRFPEPKPQTFFSKGFHETVGGTAAGKALNLNRLGMEVTLHGMIGDDETGARLRGVLAHENVPLVCDIDPAGTQRHVNLMEDSGRRISIYVVYATFEPVVDLDRLEPLIAASDVVALNLSNYCRRLIPLAQKHRRPIWCDIHDYDGKNPYHQDFVDGADVLTMSSDAMPDYRAFMVQMIAAGKRLVICTHGRDGSTALDAAGQWVETPALRDYVQKDTNGAGDSFFAGVLYGSLRGDPLPRCLRLGSIVAGLTITSPELFHPDLNPALLEAEYRRHYQD